MKFELEIKDYDGFLHATFKKRGFDASKGIGTKEERWMPPLGEQTLSYAQALFLSVSAEPTHFTLTRVE